MVALYTNNATTTLASDITDSATSLTVASGKGALFPNPTSPDYFYCTLQSASGTTIEIVQVTARSSDTFTIVRAQDNTTASAFTAGATVELRVVAAEMTSLTSGVVQGGGTDQVFTVHGNTVNTSYSIPANSNAGTFGPVTVASGAVVTIPSTSNWTVV